MSLERAAKDYGVVLELVDKDKATYKINEKATKVERQRIAKNRKDWLYEEPLEIAKKYRENKLDMYDLIRQYGVICDWGTGELFEDTTAEFRKLLKERAMQYWD